MEDLLEKTTSLINAGRFRQAEIELSTTNDPSAYGWADYWIQLAQLALLRGNEREAEHYAAHGRKCADWNPVVHEGGFHRDMAHWLIRQATIVRRSSSTLKYETSIRQASESLDAAEELFQGDMNLIGSITMARAKLAYAEQNYDTAIDLHLLANTQLTDPVWKRNNQFHLLRASYFSTNPTPSGLRLVLIEKITKEDPSFKHRLAARVIILTGKFGCRLYDRITAA